MSDPTSDPVPGPAPDPTREHLRPECAAVYDDLVELALGTLSGKDRAVALAHLETCARCSADVDELSAAADRMLHLAPEAEPPIGFEGRVFERLGLRPAPAGWKARLAWRPQRALLVAAAAVVVAFAVGALAGSGIGGGGTSPRLAHISAGGGPPIELASLVHGGRSVGGVLVYAGNPTWLFMYMDDPAGQGTLRCEVVMDQGPTVVLGRFWLSGGKGAWAASIDQPAGRLRQARVVNSGGQVLAVADLS